MLEKNSLHLRREQGAGRLNKHTMRKLISIYGHFIKYEKLIYVKETLDTKVVGMGE